MDRVGESLAGRTLEADGDRGDLRSVDVGGAAAQQATHVQGWHIGRVAVRHGPGRQKRLIPGLVQDDFSVFDNEKPQPIIYFDNSVQPITVVVMLDTSGSMTLTIDLLKQAAEQFILRLLPEDRGRVGAFNDKIQFSSAASPAIATSWSATSRSWTTATARGCGTRRTRASKN